MKNQKQTTSLFFAFAICCLQTSFFSTVGVQAGTLAERDDQHVDSLQGKHATLVDELRITEINYNPIEPSADELTVDNTLNNDDFEFIELTNTGANTINLQDAAFTNGIEFTFGNIDLAPQTYVLIVKNEKAFSIRYGSDHRIAGEYSAGSLSNSGETIRLEDSLQNTVLEFGFETRNEWPWLADGWGATLEIIDTSEDYDDPHNWRASGELGGSPGQAGKGRDGRVVINEVMGRAIAPFKDAIELFNTTASDIDLGGWFLSDSKDYTKFVLPQNLFVPAGGYIVITEDDLDGAFGINGTRGEELFLVESDPDGKPSGFVDYVTFRSFAVDETLGRWPDGSGELFPMTEQTLLDNSGEANGRKNSGPRIGPVVISEIMYHPPHDESNNEFIVVYNTGQEAENMAAWRIRGGIDYDFPGDAFLAAHGKLIVVGFETADESLLQLFRQTYGFNDQVQILSSWSGRLANDGERLELYRFELLAGDTNDSLFILEDRVIYDDKDPWPEEPDGDGPLLQRIDPRGFGGDPNNWRSSESSLDVEDELSVENPAAYRLSAVYPNPFNSEAKFFLWVRESQHTKISLFDMLGRKVETLFDGKVDSNREYRFGIDSSLLSSGLYYIDVRGDRFRAIRKAILLK